MKIAVKSVLAGAAIAVAAAFGAPMAHADSAPSDGTHSGTYASHSAEREATKYEPATKTSRHWGPSQFGG